MRKDAGASERPSREHRQNRVGGSRRGRVGGRGGSVGVCGWGVMPLPLAVCVHCVLCEKLSVVSPQPGVYHARPRVDRYGVWIGVELPFQLCRACAVNTISQFSLNFLKIAVPLTLFDRSLDAGVSRLRARVGLGAGRRAAPCDR